MDRITFDPSEGPTAEQQEAEAQALKQGELLANAEAEDKARQYAQAEAENEQAGLIAGKFTSQEELVRAYEELQKKLGQPKTEEEEEPSEEQEEPVEEAPTEEEAEEKTPEEEKVAKTVELMEDLGQKFANEGALDEESIEQLSSLDSRELVDAYLQYFQKTTEAQKSAAVNAQQITQIKESVGGEQAYADMIQWAGENLTPQEVQEFNTVTNSGSVPAIKFAVAALANRYRGAEGYEAPLVTGNKPAPKAKGFRSQAELARAIADPRYSTDPAYRQDVEQKLARSGDLL